MKRDLGNIYRETQIILQRAACGSRATDWLPLPYSVTSYSGSRIENGHNFRDTPNHPILTHHEIILH